MQLSSVPHLVLLSLTWATREGRSWLALASVGAWLIGIGTVTAQEKTTRFDPRLARAVASLAADRAYAIQFSADESLLVTGSYDDGIRSFDTTTWELRRNLVSGHQMIDCFAFAPTRDRVIAASAGNATVKLWDFTPGKVVYDLQGHNSLVFAIAFSPDGKLLASAAQRTNPDGYATSEVIFWEVASGRQVRTISQPTRGMIKTIAFSPDGRLLACGGGSRDGDAPNGEVMLWEVETGKESATLESPPGDIQRVAFSPDGRSLAAAADQLLRGAMVVWDVATGREQFRADALPSGALDLAYSPDGRLLAVVVGDMNWRNLVAVLRGRDPNQLKDAEATFRPGDVNFYDAHSGEPLGVLPHNVPLHRLTFSPRGKYLATAGFDLNTDSSKNKTVAVWDLFPTN